MDHGLRGRRLLLTLLAACAGRAAEPVGFSHATASTHDSSTDAGTAAHGLPWLTSDAGVPLAKVTHVVQSQHGLGRFEGDISASADGSLYVETHRERATGKAGPTYAMKRGPDGWTWFAEDDSGVLLDDHTNANVRAQCAGCHADAPSDGLFR